MRLRDYGIGKRQLRQGGGRGTGNDHWEDLIGCTELYIYQPPGKKLTGYDTLKAYIEAEGCEIIFTLDAPPELAQYETMRITHKRTQPIPPPVIKRAHSWAHQRNFLHSFFKPLYR
jgi:hypothetical protein